MVLMHKLTKGKVPPLHSDILDESDKTLISDIENAKTNIEKFLETFRFRDALFEVIDLSRKGNKYMQDKQPWIVARELEKDPSKQTLIDNCLHLCLQLTANLAIFINPFLPDTAKKIQHMLKVVDKMLDWENAGKLKLLSVGYSLRPPELLFRKIEDEEIEKQMEKLQVRRCRFGKKSRRGTKAADYAPVKPEITYDDFAKLDLRTGVIVSAEKVEKADKLLKLEIDLGFEKRTVVSGYSPASQGGRHCR